MIKAGFKSPEDRRAFNHQQLELANQMIQNKNILAMTPEGGGSDLKWSSGIGRVIQNAPDNVQVVFMNIKGLSFSDIYKHSISKQMGIKPKQKNINVELKLQDSKSQLSAKIPNFSDPNAVTSFLEAEYRALF